MIQENLKLTKRQIIKIPNSLVRHYKSFIINSLNKKEIYEMNNKKLDKQKLKNIEKYYNFVYDKCSRVEFYKSVYYVKVNIKVKRKLNLGSYKSVHWLNKRNEVFNRDNHKCINCGSENKLNCHHNYYIKGRKNWEYPLFCFSTLCSKCHYDFHEKIKGSSLVIRNKKELSAKIKEERKQGFFI